MTEAVLEKNGAVAVTETFLCVYCKKVIDKHLVETKIGKAHRVCAIEADYLNLEPRMIKAEERAGFLNQELKESEKAYWKAHAEEKAAKELAAKLRKENKQLKAQKTKTLGKVVCRSHFFKLKPCPFCGSKDIRGEGRIKPGKDFFSFTIKCNDCIMGTTRDCWDIKHLIDGWNKRK